MHWLGIVFLGVTVTTSGLIKDIGNPLPTNQSYTSTAAPTETVHVCPDEGFTQKGLYKKPDRSLWNKFKNTPWRLSRHCG